MADDAEEQQFEGKRLGQLETQARANGYLIYSTMAVTVLVTVALVIWIAVIGLRIEQRKPPTSEKIEANLSEVDERLSTLYEQIIEQQQKMKNIEVRIKVISEKQTYEEIAVIQQILLSQQRDYATFLTIMEGGMVNLANMVRGSRLWTKTYSARMKKAKAATKKQIKELSNIQTLTTSKTKRKK